MRYVLMGILALSVLIQSDATDRTASNAITLLQFGLFFALPFTHQATPHKRRNPPAPP